jgi:hypothetical protein
MFYDFNRHKKLAQPDQKPQEKQPFDARLQNLLARIPEKVKMPVLILLISMTGLGFLRLIIEGITAGAIPRFTTDGPGRFYLGSIQPFQKCKDSPHRTHIRDSLSKSSPKR